MSLLDLFQPKKPKLLAGRHTVVNDGEVKTIVTVVDSTLPDAETVRLRKLAANRRWYWRNKDAVRERERQRQRNLSPEKRLIKNQKNAERRRIRMENDPKYVAAVKAVKKRWREKQKAEDPDFLKREAEKQLARLHAMTPEERAERNAYQRWWRKNKGATDPAWVAKNKERNKKYKAKRREESLNGTPPS